MLVLTRKANEQILIGDDITITLVRVRGNCVRVGIEAPRDVRVVRGELAERASEHDTELGDDPVERETVFAHPPQKIGRHTVKLPQKALGNRMPEEQVLEEQVLEEQVLKEQAGQAASSEEPRIYVGRVRPSAVERKSGRAPLAGFVSAT